MAVYLDDWLSRRLLVLAVSKKTDGAPDFTYGCSWDKSKALGLLYMVRSLLAWNSSHLLQYAKLWWKTEQAQLWRQSWNLKSRQSQSNVVHGQDRDKGSGAGCIGTHLACPFINDIAVHLTVYGPIGTACLNQEYCALVCARRNRRSQSFLK